MLNLAICGGKLFTKHSTGERHPESRGRYDAVEKALRRSMLWRRDNSIALRKASMEELALCHDIDYIELVKRECLRIPPGSCRLLTTGDVVISSSSYDVATVAVGSGLQAVDAVMGGVALRAFCPLRPPGHHATRRRGMGFCLFNNIAVAVRYAQRVYGVGKVAIIDWDVHHGNGTQDIFYDDPSVFYFSTHQRGIYPGTGFSEETGSGAAVGTTCNIPIDGGESSRELLLSAYDIPLTAAMETFRPELLFISAGFDAHVDDPLGGLNLTTEDFTTLTEKVTALAARWCQGRVISLLEGGYQLEALADAVDVHTKALQLINFM